MCIKSFLQLTAGFVREKGKEKKKEDSSCQRLWEELSKEGSAGCRKLQSRQISLFHNFASFNHV